MGHSGKAEEGQVTALGLRLLSPPLKSLFFILACWEHPEEGLAVVTLPRVARVEKWRPGNHPLPAVSTRAPGLGLW